MTARHVKLLAALRKIDAAIVGNTPYSVDQSLYASCIKAIENYAAECESLRSRLAEVEAEHAAFSNNVEQCEKENDRLRDWQRRAVVELTLAQYRLRDHPDQDGFNNMRALIEEADHE